MNGRYNLFIVVLLVLSLGMAVTEVAFNLHSETISESTQVIWAIIFLFSTIMWAYYDADRKDFDKPFDFGLLVYVFWPIALPWYLLKTRGLEGVLIFLGFLFLFVGPWLAGYLTQIYVAGLNGSGSL
ncbi:hypothetical protein [Pontibacterium sp.]|uniref:hypothetical protein n=1 Tax=Pontibacterium sp. TaxID=2036026 RepID=UPI0035127656